MVLTQTKSDATSKTINHFARKKEKTSKTIKKMRVKEKERKRERRKTNEGYDEEKAKEKKKIDVVCTAAVIKCICGT